MNSSHEFVASPLVNDAFLFCRNDRDNVLEAIFNFFLNFPKRIGCQDESDVITRKKDIVLKRSIRVLVILHDDNNVHFTYH